MQFVRRPLRTVVGISAALVLHAAPASAQATAADKASPLSLIQLGVTFEGYYEYNWNRPYDRVNLLRAYDTRANTFGIQQTAVVIELPLAPEGGRRFGARLDLQFGQATATTQGSVANEPRPDVYRNIWQVYGSYVFDVGRGLQMDFGKFGSNLGIETNYAKDNPQFSRALLFDFLPFYHMGFRFTLPVSDKLTLMYMLTNGVQQTEEFNNFKSSHVTAIVQPTKTITWTTSYFAGQEQPDSNLPGGPNGFLRVFDSYATYSPTERLGLSLDLNRTTNQVHRADSALSLVGIGAYARYQASEKAALAVRFEHLDDEGLMASGINQVLHEVTATLEHKFADGFLARLEYRRDWSDRDFFTTQTPGVLKPSQNTVLLGLIWWFGNKPGSY